MKCKSFDEMTMDPASNFSITLRKRNAAPTFKVSQCSFLPQVPDVRMIGYVPSTASAQPSTNTGAPPIPQVPQLFKPPLAGGR